MIVSTRLAPGSTWERWPKTPRRLFGQKPTRFVLVKSGGRKFRCLDCSGEVLASPAISKLLPRPELKARAGRTEFKRGSKCIPELIKINIKRIIRSRAGTNPKGLLGMAAQIQLGQVSRRTALSLIGVGGAFAMALPATILAVSEAEAQTAGMDRRQDRRAYRRDLREDRRANRQTRRDARRGVPTTTTTGSAK